MSPHPLAGQPAPPELLADIPKLVSSYYSEQPDPGEPSHRVAFGTSGHRGSSLHRSFNEAHILATTQAICEHRNLQGIAGPLYLGKDTHALSEPATRSALEVLAANGVTVCIDAADGYTPTPVLSRAILRHNHDARGPSEQADGIVVTPSHNPPEDGGFKYNPPHGGPADTDVTKWIEARANALMRDGNAGVKRVSYARALAADSTVRFDFVSPYVEELGSVVDMEAVGASRLSIGADPMGGAGVAYWEPIAERYKLDIEVVNPRVDPTFSFMRLDKDGKIRMDCSSPFAMAGLVELKERFDVAFGNDTDYDRHGIVTHSGGLMNPNHYLAVAIGYLFRNRSGWAADAAVGKTLVSSSMIDRVAGELGRPLREVPVGFKWFVPGLVDGSYGFGGEESAGASFLRRDGSVWTTDKDGIIMDLLACEILARTERDPADHYADLCERFGSPCYERIDAPATPEQKDVLKKLSPEKVRADSLAGDAIIAKLTRAPGNDAEIGGLKVVTDHGWFAARPSGTEAVYKIYAESFRDEAHLRRIQDEAREIVADALSA